MRNVVPKLSFSHGIRSVIPMTALENHAFTELLAAWRRREDARMSGDIRSLGDARLELDRRRVEMHSTLNATR